MLNGFKPYSGAFVVMGVNHGPIITQHGGQSWANHYPTWGSIMGQSLPNMRVNHGPIITQNGGQSWANHYPTWGSIMGANHYPTCGSIMCRLCTKHGYQSRADVTNMGVNHRLIVHH